jgi:TadE-like protein
VPLSADKEDFARTPASARSASGVGLPRIMRRIAHNELGTAVVEAAVILPLILLLAFGILDFGRAMNYFNNATHLANEGARYAAVNANPGGSGKTLQEYIVDQGDTAEMRAHSTACIDFPSGNSIVGQPVEVKVKTTFSWLPFFGNTKLFGSLGFSDVTMTGRAVMRLEQKPTVYAPDGSC